MVIFDSFLWGGPPWPGAVPYVCLLHPPRAWSCPLSVPSSPPQGLDLSLYVCLLHPPRAWTCPLRVPPSPPQGLDLSPTCASFTPLRAWSCPLSVSPSPPQGLELSPKRVERNTNTHTEYEDRLCDNRSVKALQAWGGGGGGQWLGALGDEEGRESQAEWGRLGAGGGLAQSVMTSCTAAAQSRLYKCGSRE